MCLGTNAEAILAILTLAPIRHLRDTSPLRDFRGLVESLPYLGQLTGLELWSLHISEAALLANLLASPRQLAGAHSAS